MQERLVNKLSKVTRSAFHFLLQGARSCASLRGLVALRPLKRSKSPLMGIGFYPVGVTTFLSEPKGLRHQLLRGNQYGGCKLAAANLHKSWGKWVKSSGSAPIINTNDA